MFDVIDGHLHDGWTGDVAHGYDIAVLKLDREANSTVLPRLASEDVPLWPGDLLVATGWGQTESAHHSHILRLADKIAVVEHKYCEVPPEGADEDSWICAGALGQDTCRGQPGIGCDRSETASVRLSDRRFGRSSDIGGRSEQ